MSYGSANHTLTTGLLYHYAKLAGATKCYRCDKEIENAGEFSKDHKVDWLHSGKPIELFFDLTNVAFSHKKCNRNRGDHQVVRNKSGFKGVYQSNARHKIKPWYARVRHNGTNINLGEFETPLAAAIAYDKAVVQIKGQECVTNKSLGLL